MHVDMNESYWFAQQNEISGLISIQVETKSKYMCYFTLPVLITRFLGNETVNQDTQSTDNYSTQTDTTSAFTMISTLASTISAFTTIMTDYGSPMYTEPARDGPIDPNEEPVNQIDPFDPLA